ncbi:ThiF family protein [Kribbella sp. VKM Ac-2571]|uniref:hypothetical protein n=1 Tax=Kribbella sp. VKM Ac-2571 TaxID=2512222 RepID=UPI00105E9214|nr:hypothetical protein [Kribbella sp. VKM Ac-2571]TDO58213.1 ThiF family protein [Kribbella sp. VKM Ac-2571]
MNIQIPSPREFSRPAKALVDGGAVATFGDAQTLLARTRPQIITGPDCVTVARHAALLTAVETTRRAFGEVDVHLPRRVADALCTMPGQNHSTVAEVVRDSGGRLVTIDALATTVPTIVIGTTAWVADITLQVTWDRWVAHVDHGGRHLPERGNMTLSAVAAAALAVTECFKRTLGTLEACHRNRTLNLWRPGQDHHADSMAPADDDTAGPDLRHLPSAVWFVGLGHLGQANAWCWTLLPYADAAECEIYLQDFDKVNRANHTTGMFVSASDEGVMKTRVVADALEQAGFATRMIERRLLAETRRHDTEPGLALLGVDKVEPRRLISDIGWKLAIDVGLGSGPIDFTAVSIHTFPATKHSKDVAAWQTNGSSRRSETAQEQKAYRDARAAGADACGLIQLAETAVAAPFVGVVAACLAIAEPLRILHGEPANTSLTFDIGRLARPRSTLGTTTPRIGFVSAATLADV